MLGWQRERAVRAGVGVGAAAGPCLHPAPVGPRALPSQLLTPPASPPSPPPPPRRRMLVKDPGQRISMPGIMAHPWFTASLPQGLLETNARVDPEQALQVGG